MKGTPACAGVSSFSGVAALGALTPTTPRRGPSTGFTADRAAYSYALGSPSFCKLVEKPKLRVEVVAAATPARGPRRDSDGERADLGESRRARRARARRP